jgi:hypothetical protein
MYAARRRLGYEKPQSAQAPLCGFVSATLGAGVIATQCPITCPKRHIPPERYMTFALTKGREW